MGAGLMTVEADVRACVTLRERLTADRVLFVRVVDDDRISVVSADPDRVAPFIGEFPLEVFSAERLCAFRAGRVVVVPDVDAVTGADAAAEAHHLSGGVRAYVAVPIVDGGAWVATMGVHQYEPRAWSDDEVEVVRATAVTAWERSARRVQGPEKSSP